MQPHGVDVALYVCDADGDREPGWFVGHDDWTLCDCEAELLANEHGLQAVHFGRNHHELLTTVARQCVGTANHFAHPLRNGDKGGVAGDVAECVVEDFEVVDVEEDDREAALVAQRGKVALELVDEVALVVAAGEGVGGRVCRPRCGSPPRGWCW